MDVNKADLLKNIQNFIGAENDLAIKEAQHQIGIFKAIYDQEVDAYEKLEEKEKALHPSVGELNVAILKAIASFEKNESNKAAEKEKQEKTNLKLKETLLRDFESLINDKEKLAELATGIKGIREKWNNIGDIPEKYQQKVQKEYSRLNEAFNYNFNIYKELKENDLKRNYSLKNQVIHELKALSSLKDIGKLRIELKMLQNKWEEIGPTFKEHWENIKKEYWQEVHSIQHRINDYYVQLKSNLKENLEKKKVLIEKAKELGTILPTDAKSWESKTEQFKNLQEEWKKAGPVAKNISDDVWNEFRSHFDVFFEKRNSFLSTEKKKWKANTDAKQAIIDKAKGFVENIAENNNPQLIKQLQVEWKKVGHAGRFAEQKLWKKFRQQCDAFFDKKNAAKNALFEEEKKNLTLKNELIKTFNNKKEVDFEGLSSFINEFQKIGGVPKKDTSSTMKNFETAVKNNMEKNKFSDEQSHQIQKAIKSSLLHNSSDPEKAFMEEKSRISKLIDKTLKETSQLENNLNFFSASKGSSMLDQFQQQIDQNKRQIDNWREELKKLRDAYRQK
jgi:hypothetical protein